MGEAPKGLTLERVNNNKGYSLENCKWATFQSQARNKRTQSNNSSGASGVSKNKGKWRARTKIKGKEVYFGLFDTLEEAKSAREIGIAKVWK
jgi:hypothetical protein